MATFVIVHGAFGGGWEWREVASLLRARGHDVFTPSLTGFAERVHLATPETGLATHIQDILNLLRYEDLHRVILACQSYGGMVVTAVADRMPERLAHLVYLNALVPEDGQAVFDLLPPAIRQRFAEAARTAGEGWRVPAPPFEDDPIIAAFARGRHVPSPLRMFTDPIQLGHAPDLPRTYIWCTEDPAGLAGVADLMQPFAARAQRDPRWRFHQLTSPPDAFIHMPQAVAELFDEVAQTGEAEPNAFQEPADARSRKTPRSQ
jgi:pimeloyl-ACP methyl ester carboxylesterase